MLSEDIYFFFFGGGGGGGGGGVLMGLDFVLSFRKFPLYAVRCKYDIFFYFFLFKLNMNRKSMHIIGDYTLHCVNLNTFEVNECLRGPLPAHQQPLKKGMSYYLN